MHFAKQGRAFVAATMLFFAVRMGGAPHHLDFGYGSPSIAGAATTTVTSASFTPTSMVFVCWSRLTGSGCSPAQTATLKNTGASTLRITGVGIVGSYFSLASHCGTTLAPGKSCTMTVSFHGYVSRARPQKKTYYGTVHVDANLSSGYKTISLTGITSAVP